MREVSHTIAKSPFSFINNNQTLKSSIYNFEKYKNIPVNDECILDKLYIFDVPVYCPVISSTNDHHFIFLYFCNEIEYLKIFLQLYLMKFNINQLNMIQIKTEASKSRVNRDTSLSNVC